jgi:hypothetical protein
MTGTKPNWGRTRWVWAYGCAAAWIAWWTMAGVGGASSPQGGSWAQANSPPTDFAGVGLRPVAPGASSEIVLPETAPSQSPAKEKSSPEETGRSGGMHSWVLPSPSETCPDPWTWQVLPDGVIYKSYLAGQKEPRLASVWNYVDHYGWVWDAALGGRVGILRCGSSGPEHPQGWEIDVEGAAFPRLDLEHDRDLTSADFRFGVPLTYGNQWWQTKLAFYHISAHLGDEFMIRNPGGFSRINYSRDVLVWGNSVYPTPNLRLYAEAGWAFATDGGSEPWEFQFGLDYSPVARTDLLRGSPFVALNGHLREEVDFGGNFVVQAGWQWRGATGHLLRLGAQYNTGKSEQYQIFNRTEEKFGLGIWYDY